MSWKYLTSAVCGSALACILCLNERQWSCFPFWSTRFHPCFCVVSFCLLFVDHCLFVCPYSFGHCIVCLWFTASDYPFGSCCSIFSFCVLFVDHCLSFCPYSFGHCIVCPWFTASDYPFGSCCSIFSFCVLFVDHCLSFCPYSFSRHCIVCLWFTA